MTRAPARRQRLAALLLALSLAAAPAAGFAQEAAPGGTAPEAPAAAGQAQPAPAGAMPEAMPADAVPADAGPADVAPAELPGIGELPRDLSAWGMFIHAGPVVKAVMIGLVAASVVTWTIALAKGMALLGASFRARRLLDRLSRVHTLAGAVQELQSDSGPGREMVRAAAEEAELSASLPAEGVKERTAAAFARIESQAVRRLGRGTAILASIGSTAPFVGLFGTVWGIMDSFIGISEAQTTNLAIVAPGIAEALLATALGLVAAIPAVVIYNAFARATSGYRARLTAASGELLRLLSRDLDRQARQSGPGEAWAAPRAAVRP